MASLAEALRAKAEPPGHILGIAAGPAIDLAYGLERWHWHRRVRVHGLLDDARDGHKRDFLV